MKKAVAILAAAAILFCGLWLYEMNDRSDAEELCQRYASEAAGAFRLYVMSKEANDEPLIGDYWGGVSSFYAFMDSYCILKDDWDDLDYQKCSVVYDHMILAPDEVLSHMDDVLGVMELLAADYNNGDAWRMMSELSYKLQYVWE